MIEYIIINNNKIKIKTISQCSKLKTKTKTLIINNHYILNQRSPIIYKCDGCGKVEHVNFRLREKFFKKQVYCKQCNKEHTFLKKYGNKSFFGTDEANKLIKKTKLKRYGDENYTNRNKAKQTNLKRYGDENYTNRNKAKQTNLKRYGVSNNFSRLDIKKKIKQTNLKRYGVENSFQSKEIKEKIKQTNIKRYGSEYPMMNKIISNKTSKKLSLNKIKKFIDSLFLENLTVTPLFIKENYKSSLNYYFWKCNICGTEFEDNIAMGQRPKCPVCFPKLSGISIMEKEIVDWIKSFEINLIENDRKILNGKELDIYIPSHSLAIEFNGLYWHSDKYKEKNYHINKTLECKKQNIHLIHIFEDEWLNKQDIIKNRLKNLLGLNANRIGARKTIIKEIDLKTKNIFLNKYHIQGEDKSNIKLGAFYNDKLIGVMTFSKLKIFMSKKAKDGSWELSRFVTIPDTYTPGLASKMLKYFERNWKPKLIESFADRRWSQGNLYKKLGFKFNGQTSPNYYYFKDNQKRYHKYKFRKSELTKFDNYSIKKTEKQIMNEAGWSRIYDCGNYKFVKE